MRKLNKRTIVAVAFFGVALFTSDVQAQRRRPFGGFGGRLGAILLRNPVVQEDLKLTDSQKQEVEKLRKKAT
jgi:hypothetical protein